MTTRTAKIFCSKTEAAQLGGSFEVLEAYPGFVLAQAPQQVLAEVARSQGALQLDNTNNVEVIRVARPQKGTWRLRVIGSNVARGPQRYAFTLSGKVVF